MRHSGVVRGILISAAAVSVAVSPVSGQGGSQQGGSRQGRRPMPSEQRRQRTERMYVQGEVVLEDGTPGPPNVLIERQCGAGNGIPETYTDSRGRFSFQVGNLTGFNPDATQGFAPATPGLAGEELTSLSALIGSNASSIAGEKVVTGCSLRAVLPGFRSTVVTIGPRNRSDDPDVGALVLVPLEDVEGLSLSLVSLRAPEGSRSSFEKGMKDFEKRKWKNARQHFEQAIEAYPENAEAWFALGRTHEEQKKPEKAREGFEKAVALDDRFVPPLIGLARLDAGEARWEAVAQRTHRVLAMNPNDFPEAYFYDAVANFNQKRYPAAEKSAREAIARGAEGRFPQVLHLLAMSCGYQGKAEEAIAGLRRYLEMAPDGDTAPAARQQLEGLESYLAKQRASTAEP